MAIGLNKQLLMDFDELPYSLAPNAKSREPSPARSRPVEAKGFGQEWIQRCMKNCATLRNEPVVVTREMIQYFSMDWLSFQEYYRLNVYCRMGHAP